MRGDELPNLLMSRVSTRHLIDKEASAFKREVNHQSSIVNRQSIHFGLTRLDQKNRYIPVRIRVPVTRVALIGRTERFGKYQAPPIDIDLSEIKYDSKLRVQFHLSPQLTNGELQCRLFWGEPFPTGEISSRLKNTYDIPLHRWRDRFGTKTFGTVQVLCSDGWIEIANLVSSQMIETQVFIPETPRPPGYWQKLISQLYNAQSIQEKEHFIHKCLDCADSNDCPEHALRQLVYVAVDSLLLLGKYSEVENTLSRFQEFADWSGFYPLKVKIDLRTKQLDSFEINDIDNSVKSKNDIPQKYLLQAELIYRLARAGNAMKKCLKSCLHLINQHKPQTAIEKIELDLLDLIVSLHLGKQHKKIISGRSDVKQIVRVLEIVAQYIKTSIHNWKNERVSWDTRNYLLNIWHPDDVTFVSLCVAQANKEIEKARNLLDALLDSNLEFRGLELLKARQYYLEGNKEKANEVYFDIIDEYPFVIGEIS